MSRIGSFLFVGMPFLVMLNVLVTSCKLKHTSDNDSKPIIHPKTVTPINWVGHWLNEGDREKLTREAANEFEFRNQEIRVNVKFPEEIYKGDDSLEIRFIIEQMQKPTPDWDIVRIKEHYVAIAAILKDPDWGQKYLVDFSTVPGFIERQQPFINSNLIKGHSGNILVGPYNEGQFWALYVNTLVAKKMGISVKQYDMTFDDFLGYIKSVSEYNKLNHTNISCIFEDKFWISTEAIFRRLFYSLMDNFDECLNTKMTEKKLKAIEKCYEACEQMSRYKPIIKTRMQVNWGRDNDYPLKDSCVFFVNGSWMYNIWRQKGKKKMGDIMPCELPVFKPSDTYLGGYTSNWAVLKNAPHKAEAIKLMMFWCEPKMAEKWARYTKCPSGVKGNMTNTTFGVDPYEDFMFNIEKRYGGKKISEVENKYILGEKNYSVSLHIIDVLEGRLSAKEAFSQLKRKLVY